ncbi:hypothetical protein D3C77_267000 [compost metagenome]
MDKPKMTNEEAVEVIKKNYPPENYTRLREALDMAIKALGESDPIPPTIKPGDTTTIKFNCRECDFECVVQYDSEVFVDIDKGHCPHCGNADAVDLEVISHD